MASKEETAEEAGRQQTHIKQRTALNNAYAAIEGQKSIQSFTAFTFEEALDNQIERIEGQSSRLRPNELDRVRRVEEEVIKAANELKKIPPEQFLRQDESRDVNTDPQFRSGGFTGDT